MFDRLSWQIGRPRIAVSGSLQSEEASSPEEERTYKRLLELRDLFHDIISELDSPTPGLPSISNIVSMQSRRQR